MQKKEGAEACGQTHCWANDAGQAAYLSISQISKVGLKVMRMIYIKCLMDTQQVLHELFSILILLGRWNYGERAILPRKLRNF